MFEASQNAILWWKILTTEIGYPAHRGDVGEHKVQADFRADGLVTLFFDLGHAIDSKVIFEIGAFAAYTQSILFVEILQERHMLLRRHQ